MFSRAFPAYDVVVVAVVAAEVVVVVGGCLFVAETAFEKCFPGPAYRLVAFPCFLSYLCCFVCFFIRGKEEKEGIKFFIFTSDLFTFFFILYFCLFFFVCF